MAEISVIVPVYKVEAFLDRCVSSILTQTFDDFELILVDDGSPDNCGALCDGYAARDCRVHVIHQENGGLSAARNAGIDYAIQKGESQWLAFIDSDDWVHPEYLQRLYGAVRDTGCKISACGCVLTAGETIPAEQDRNVEILSDDDYYCGNYHDKATPVAWGKLYHVDLFDTLRYPVGKLHEDEFTTYLTVYQAGQVAATPAQLYAYFQNPKGITQSAWNPRRLDALEGFENQIAFAQKHGKTRLLCSAAEMYIFGTYEHLNQAGAEYRGVLRSKLRRALKLGRECGCFPGNRRNLWAYEAAYPCKILWWLISKLPEGGKT